MPDVLISQHVLNPRGDVILSCQYMLQKCIFGVAYCVESAAGNVEPIEDIERVLKALSSILYIEGSIYVAQTLAQHTAPAICVGASNEIHIVPSTYVALGAGAHIVKPKHVDIQCIRKYCYAIQSLDVVQASILI